MGRETLGAEILRVLGPFFPEELVSAKALRALGKTLRIFPSQISRVFGFECRLGTAAQQTDFFMRVTADTGGRDFLSTGTLGGEGVVRSHPAWERIREFALAWAAQGSPLNRDIHHIWFEFDVPLDSYDKPLPGILFLHPRASDHPTRSEWSDRLIGLTSLSSLIVGREVPLDVQRCLEGCLANLPETAYVFCIGIMVKRSATDLRLCLKGIRHGEHLPYLAQVGFPNAERLSDCLNDLGRYVDVVNIDLDVGSRIGATCHLEFRCDEEVNSGALERWRRFMDVLVARRLALPQKAEAFLSWPRLPTERLRRANTTGLFLHKLSHVKLSFQDGRPLETKGYFGVWECVRFRSRVTDSHLRDPA